LKFKSRIYDWKKTTPSTPNFLDFKNTEQFRRNFKYL